MKKILVVLIILVAVYIIFSMKNKEDQNQTKNTILPVITTVEHASFVMNWGGVTIYNDPVGEASLYASSPPPAIILLSDIHGDHFNLETLSTLVGENTKLIAPEAVAEKLEGAILEKTEVLKNGQVSVDRGFTIEAIPMYNLPESLDAYHTRGRGNGYLVEGGGVRVYIAGDTADIPEMRALEDIDIAFIPMNLPYTMDIETASSVVLEFIPKIVIPYHYRGPNGLSDVAKFKSLVNERNPAIEVLLLDWYK